MSSHTTSTIFVIGGTGAQGMPIVAALVADKKYSVRVLTRDASSPRAQALLALGNVSILEGSFADEAVLREGFRGCDGAYVNIDGFNTGEKTETYWAIRSYEIAIEEGIKFFVYGNLDYALKQSGYEQVPQRPLRRQRPYGRMDPVSEPGQQRQDGSSGLHLRSLHRDGDLTPDGHDPHH